ncbi:MAG: hypothetical protein MJ146_04255 [Clostridia bacterium]|nr:hypothetical protein [Clostridia bacterium]
MNKFFESRFYKITILIVILISILAVRLFVLTVLQHGKWQAEAQTQSIETIYTSAPRGDILDRNGIVLATSKQIFNVTFNSSNLTTKEINDSTYNLIKILESNGEKYTYDFPIKRAKNGSLYFSFESKINKWLKSVSLPTSYTAEQTFTALRERYNIDPTIDRYEAYDQLEKKYNLDIPINVKRMKYTDDLNRENFLILFGWPESEAVKKITASQCFNQLKKDFEIDSSLSTEDVLKILNIRYKIKQQGFMRYMPVTISKNVGKKTITYISEYSANLPGVEVVSETERVYPKGRLGSHILGYMGSISDSEMDYYVGQLGYEISDLVGKAGIESAFEEKLKGKDGQKVIKVNSAGEYIDTISETKAKKGSDVYLTIDSKLQADVERTLEGIVHAVASGTSFNGKYTHLGTNGCGSCQSGAIVVLDVKTSDVLAMASYPDYDPNKFADGISDKDWKAVQSKNPRDSLSPTPLYSLATSTAVQPGSTFKPITSITALRCGLNPNRTIYDGGYIEIGDRTFGCDSWNNYGGSHGSETLPLGIQNSCNYYFYCIGTGKDYNTGASLGYKITTQDLMDTAADFGLGEKTGIELPEVVADLPSEETKLQNTKISLWTYLYNNARSIFPKKVADNYDDLSKEIDKICSWMDQNPERDEISDRMKKQTSVKKSKVESLTDVIKYSYFNYSQWTLGDSFNLCIGQGDDAFTPLQMARYVATLANGGTLNKVSIVKNIEHEGITQKPKGKNLNLNKKDLSYVYDGMHRVTTNGTLAGVFAGFPIKCCGKTGTAERHGAVQPKNEVKYVRSHLSSFTSKVSWSQVEKWMKKLMKSDPKTYPDKNSAVDDALIQASNGKVSQAMIDSYKGTYEPFAWTICFAPADDPQIAVVVMLVQGKYSYNAGIAAREVVGSYFLGQKKSYTTFSNETKIN